MTLRVYVTDITKIKFIEKIEMWHGRIIELYFSVSICIYSRMLWMRIWNDLLLDLDKALLCPDEVDSHSRTDLVTFRKLSRESTSESITLTYLDQMVKCYEDAIQVLQER